MCPKILLVLNIKSFRFPRSRLLRIWSRQTGVRPSHLASARSLATHTHDESGAYTRDSSRFPRRRPFIYTANRHRVSHEFNRSRNRVPMAFHCRESAGTGPAVLKEVPVAGAAFSIEMTLFCCFKEKYRPSLFLTFSVLVANPKKLLYTVANPALIVVC